jgi:tRNA A37 threonylcarbamoyladenosine dehydratase
VNAAFQRLALITGEAALERIGRSRMIVFGLGGVGSWCAEALVRSGAGQLSIVDSDTVCVTNINRQAQASVKTIGASKTAALKNRLLEINPRCTINAFNNVFQKETAGIFSIPGYDYVIDAIDSLTHKLDLIELCAENNITLFSSMGMAQKLDPTRIKTADVWDTERCPLARLVRSGLRKRGLHHHFTVVYSPERLPLRHETAVSCGGARCLCPAKNTCDEASCNNDVSKEWCSSKKVINGSAVMVTAAAGMTLASLVIQDIVKKAEE